MTGTTKHSIALSAFTGGVGGTVIVIGTVGSTGGR